MIYLTGFEDVDVLFKNRVAVLFDESVHLVFDAVGEVKNDERRL